VSGNTTGACRAAGGSSTSVGIGSNVLANREIGEQLFLSHRTVGSHLYRMFPKLGVTSRGQLHTVLAVSGAE
jgi:DNA-binding CsgD family transcriptional regulator